MAQVLIFTGTSRFSQSNSPGYGPGTSILRPLGAYQVAAILRSHGYTVQVVDYYWYLIRKNPQKFADIVKKYVGPETLWIGWSNTFFEGNRNNDLGLVDPYIQQMSQSIGLQEKGINFLKSWCAKVNPNIKFVSGGAKSWAWSQQSFKFFDYFILGYADATILDLTNYLAGVRDKLETIDNSNGSKSVVYDQKGELFDFNNHTHVWHASDHLQQGTALPIEIARGCIFKCSYCSFPLNGKKKTDFIRDPSKIIDELTYNYETFGTTHYMYSDDTHNDSVEKLEFLYNNVYSKLPFKIQFSTYLRLDLLAAHPYTIELLKESGLVGTFFGIESFNPEANKLIGKHATEERIYENLYKVKEIWNDDVIINVGLILGLTNDSIETCTKWLDRITDKDSPINWAAIAPLQINPSKKSDPFFQNKIELNTEHYGYTFDENGVWTNNKGMTQFDAEQLKSEFDKKFSEQKTIKSWYDPHRAKALNVSTNQYYTMPSNDLVSIENSIVERYFNDLLQ